MKILITGFDPFGGENVNPAYEAVKLLPDSVKGAEIIKLEIPTVFGEAGKAVEKGIIEHNPDAVICVGQAGEERISKRNALRSIFQRLRFQTMPEISRWM